MEREEAINALSGAVAGLVTAVFVCPLDVLKTRLQVRSGSVELELCSAGWRGTSLAPADANVSWRPGPAWVGP